ncbi:MAG TPA: iron-sulfur cluster assembly scaffold protein [Steroidobacteraceae bacterium]|nr:iron-sulfur cluster assembly scaffold protein [Steroidobacteraceae bacterium]
MRRLSPACNEDWVGPGGDWAIGNAGSTEAGTWVRFALRSRAGRVTEARFKAYGCPHTLAAVAWLAEHARDKTLAQLAAEGLEEVVRSLDIPTEKLGRLLIVQDALRDCQPA